MKPLLFSVVAFMLSASGLLAQSNVTDRPVLKEGFNQRIILEPSKPTILKNRENVDVPKQLSIDMPTLHVIVPKNMDENASLPIQFKRITPNMDMNLQAMYLSGRKDPALSSTMSLLVPGLGQLYNGQTGKGIAFIATSYGGLAIGAIALSTHNNGLASVGFVTAAISYLWSAVDASLTSNAINRRHGLMDISLKGNHFSVKPAVSSLRDPKGNYLPGSTNAGLAVAFAFGDK
jgi:TM2 domain-containing membrane protein YozV